MRETKDTAIKKGQRLTTPQKKRMLVREFTRKAGNITALCQAVRISRKTYYRWLDSDDRFREQIQEQTEALLDFSESKLMQQINDGNTAALIFHLKTKGKRRGYVERQELTGADGERLAGAPTKPSELASELRAMLDKLDLSEPTRSELYTKLDLT